MLHDLNLNALEQRVLGCLIEKQHTVPDTYPLTMNSLLLACNQSSNRDPLMQLSEPEVEHALESLRTRNFARRGMYSGSRVAKHRHILDESLELDVREQAVLAVLLLRGPQTLAEIKTRTERYCSFSDLAAVDQVVEALIGKEQPLVQRVPRSTGQKEDRVTHLLGEHETKSNQRTHEDTTVSPIAAGSASRIEMLELRVASLEQALEQLQHALGIDEGVHPNV
ncbi:MAG: YceH family protein [Acidimicrobiia bacterium]